jgi:hypothetical protein
MEEDQTLEQKALAAFKKANPKDPLAAIENYSKVLLALKWFVENDDTNMWDTENRFWIDGFKRGKKAYNGSTGKNICAENEDVVRAIIHPKR